MNWIRVTISICLVIFYVNSTSSQTLSIYKSEKSVEETSRVIEELIKERNLVFFETVEHDKIAADRGVQINKMHEVLFEDGDLTTALIECQPTTALDLPLKILVWEENGDVYMAFIDPQFMKKRFMLRGCEEIVDKMGQVLARVTVDAMRAIRAKD